MLQLLQTVCEQRNLTLLMVSHNLDDAARIAPRTLLVVDGRIYYDGPTQAPAGRQRPKRACWAFQVKRDLTRVLCCGNKPVVRILRLCFYKT